MGWQNGDATLEVPPSPNKNGVSFYVTPLGGSAGGELAPAESNACIKAFSCAIVIIGSPGLLSARITTLRGAFARTARIFGSQPIEKRTARSCGPVITFYRHQPCRP